jgi:hypothetical protein
MVAVAAVYSNSLWESMMRAYVLIVALLLVGCSTTNASGPKFSAADEAAGSPNQSRVYVFRDNVFYAMQAPYIVRSGIAIDGSPIGELANSGFLIANIAPGPHLISATSADDSTIKAFTTTPGSKTYIEIYDKTRMEGARAAAGEVIAGIPGAFYGFYYSKNTNEGRIWGMDYVAAQDALPKLRQLQLSE